MEVNDQEMLSRYRAGETGAFARVVEKYRQPLFAFILNMTRSTGEADDVFQEVWFRAIRGIRRYRHGHFRGWLFRIAHNVVIDRSRRRRPDVSLDEETAEGGPRGDQLSDGKSTPGQRAETGDLARAISKAVQALPPEQKAVFLMRVEADLTFREIAQVQGTSINTALARMQYALAKLRNALKREYRDWRTDGSPAISTTLRRAPGLEPACPQAGNRGEGTPSPTGSQALARLDILGPMGNEGGG